MASVQLQLEAARAAAIAVHAAAWLAAAGRNRSVVRALRVVEGLTRSAISLLGAAADQPPVPKEVPPASEPAPRRRRRARGKRKGVSTVVEPMEVVVPSEESPGAKEEGEVAVAGNSALRQLLNSLAASLTRPDSVKAMEVAKECFVQQRVRAGCPEAEAMQEVQEHFLKFLSIAEQACHGQALRMP